MGNPKVRSFLLTSGPLVSSELQGFLRGLRSDSIISTEMVGVGTRKQSLVILYEDTSPKVVGESPTNGAVSIPTSLSVRITFDEKISNSVSSSHVEVLENGSTVSPAPTVTTSNDGYSLELSGVFGTGSAYYQIRVRSGLPFESGRTFDTEHLLSFKNA